jgi:hypothetical protein
MQGVKKAKSEWFDTVRLFRNQADGIPENVRQTFLALAREHKIPTWALRHFDLEEFVK